MAAKKPKLRFRYYTEHPGHDTIWDMCWGPDGKVYVGLCAEGVIGTAVLYAYDPARDTLEPVSDVGRATREPLTDGKIPQSKVHFSMCPADDGKIYFSTHQTVRPPGEKYWDPWGTIGDPYHGFTGAFLLVYDTQTGHTEQRGIIAPYEGVRCMGLDKRRMILYGVTYPKVHLFAYKIETGERRDIGRIGNHGSFDIHVADDGRVVATDDWGRVMIYDPEPDRMALTGAQLPGLNGKPCHYDFFIYPTEGPDGHLYGTTYLRGILFRYDMKNNIVTDLGPGLDEADYTYWSNWLHALVFDHRMNLYYDFGNPKLNPQLVKFDLRAGKKTPLGPLTDRKKIKSICIGAATASPDRRTLYFGDMGENHTARFVIMEV